MREASFDDGARFLYSGKVDRWGRGSDAAAVIGGTRPDVGERWRDPAALR
jgi:hypothetical protein